MSNVAAGPNGCIVSLYSTSVNGYSGIGWHDDDGNRVSARGHRVAWFGMFGDIPDDLTVDHVCHNKRCVNPMHLRLLTNLANACDNGWATRTHCPQGHEYTPENTRTSRTHRLNGNGVNRTCRACDAARKRRARAAAKANAA